MEKETTIQYVVLTVFKSQYDQWCINNKLKKLDHVYLADDREKLELCKVIKDFNQFSVILFDSWMQSIDYDQELTAWVLDRAEAVHCIEKVMPIVIAGKITDWRRKYGWKNKKPVSAQTFSTSLYPEEIKKLKTVVKFISKKTGETTTSAAIRYLIQEYQFS